MPIFTGLDALEVLKQSGFDVPFILVSGKIDGENAVKIMCMGARDYLMKDHLERLCPVVKRELQEARERDKKGRWTERRL